jgi:hypothetical protein
MTNQDRQSAALPQGDSVVPLRRPARLTAVDGAQRPGGEGPVYRWRRFLGRHRRFFQRSGIGIGVAVALVTLGCLTLWWRLASGPIQLDVVTPWLASAIEENFGSSHHVEVGGTQIERTENGGTAVRIRDIIVRDADGTVVASAPKAEVRVSGMSLLSGHMRAESLNLVGAEMAMRIEQDGRVTIFAGADKRPIATASVPLSAAMLLSRQEKLQGTARTAATAGTRAAAALATAQSTEPQPAPPRQAHDILAALLSWIDGIGETGLDGHDLRELGLKNGNLTVDDERTGKHWTFQDISLSVERPHGGGIVVTIGSDNPARPWVLSAAITPTRKGFRKVELEARRVLASDLFLAARLGDGNLKTDMPLSASISGEIGPDGVPQTLSGRIVADAGSITDANDANGRIAIERAEFKLNWDAANRVLSVPFQILSGGNRITLIGRVEAPEETGGTWSFKIGGGGTVVLAALGAPGEPLVLNRIAVSGRYDATTRRFVVDEGDIGNTNIGVALSGAMDFSSSDLRLRAGVAGTRMPVDALKKLWPVFVAPKVRDWFVEHFTSGTLERIVIAVNAPFETLKEAGPPIPDDGLSIEALATGCVIRPVEGLPALRDADLSVHIAGRDVTITLNKATADLPSGRKLVMSSGVFEVPDTAPHAPPARVRFKLDGPIPAAAELLRMDRLREVADAPFEPSAIRGTMSALVTMAMPLKSELPPGSTNYAITVDATNFSADRMIMGQKVEAALLRASATPQGFQLKGDVKIGGTPASLEYRKQRNDPDAEVHIQGMLDEAGRNNLGFDSGIAISGAIPIRLAGRVATTSDREGRFAVEADLTPAQIDGLLPGWVKPSGKPARATFTLATKPQLIRIEDLLIEGAGGGVKGTIELDSSGQVQSANFSAYGFSDGDRASLKAERAPDGALRVVMRGDVYDGRGFVKSAAGGASPSPLSKRQQMDIDLDLKLGAVVGFNGEALRSVDVKMTRRAGEIRSFGLTAKIGRDATLSGDLRGRAGGRQVIDLESNDAGAFFRFADVYSRMTGGQMAMVMESPSAEDPGQQGVLNVHNFAVHDEAQLERAVSNGTQRQRNGIEFTGMRVEFNRMPGRVALREGVVRGPMLGGTIDGSVDYTRDEVHLRGTLVPLYGPNNLLGQIPIVGLFMGGDKEGLLGVTYEVVGRPGNPVLRINPISALAPGLLRKVFEFPAANDNNMGNLGDTGDTSNLGNIGGRR